MLVLTVAGRVSEAVEFLDANSAERASTGVVWTTERAYVSPGRQTPLDAD